MEKLAPYDPFKNVRTTDPPTSHAAAEMVDVTEVQRRVLELHTEHPEGLTDEELLDLYRQRHGPTAESSPRKLSV